MAKPHAGLCYTINCNNRKSITRFQVNKTQPNYPVACYVFHMSVCITYVTAFDPCKSRPCQNKGICTISRSGFACVCQGNYDGTTCQSKYCFPTIYVCHISRDMNTVTVF